MKPRPIRVRRSSRAFTAIRDSHGVPRVTAATWLDALHALGYLHARDRGTQMLFARSVAAGRATEEIADAPELLETDRFFRRVGLHQNLEREVEALGAELRAWLGAYCDGVNDGLADAGRSLPMWATGFQPKPWDAQAVLLVGQLLSFGALAVSQIQNERLLIELIHAGVQEEGLSELLAPRLEGADFSLLRQIKMSSQLSNDALELLTDLPRLAGSNAWAVRPERSASGHALLAADPHLEINRLPAIWYEAVLQWDGQYVLGATLPGCPLFAVGRTRHLAWGVTHMKGDTVDYFIEDCRRGGTTGWQYRRGDRWIDFPARQEVIQRKGGVPETVPVHENEQGTLESNPDLLGEGLHLSLAWTGRAPNHGQSISPWLELIHAPSVTKAMAIARRCTQPTLCWVMADRDGHIALQASGRFPRRAPGHNGLVPIPAWDPTNHWQGFLSEEQLPRQLDPPEGFIATANEEIHPIEGPLLISQPLADYRKQRICERLEVMPSATLADMQALQYDLVSVQARELLAVFLPHLPDGEFKERLARWDHRYDPQSREAALFQRLYRHVLAEIFGHEQGIGWRRLVYLVTRAGFSTMVLTAIDRTLKKTTSAWWRGRDKGELIRRAGMRAAREEDATWSEINGFHFTDRFFGAHRVGRILGYNSRRHAMPGCHATVFQGHVLQTATRETTFAPSYHFVTEMGADEAWTNLPGGPSESRLSRLYKSDVRRWFRGEYKRLGVDL